MAWGSRRERSPLAVSRRAIPPTMPVLPLPAADQKAQREREKPCHFDAPTMPAPHTPRAPPWPAHLQLQQHNPVLHPHHIHVAAISNQVGPHLGW